jgi:glycosyl transferase, family 25
MSQRPAIWVISLERSTARRAFVAESFGDLGIPFELVDGVDGSVLTPEERAAYSHTRSLLHIGRGLTQGDLGCSLAHLKLYERMVTSEVPEVVICEDDARPTPAFLEVLDAAALFPDAWDVVTFCSQFPDSAGPTPVGDLEFAGGYRICTYRGMPFGTQCYLVRLAAARRLLKVGYPVCLPPDELVFRRYPAGLRVYGVEPRPVIPADFRSELEARPGSPRDLSVAARFFEQPIVFAGRARSRLRLLRDRLTERSPRNADQR